MTSLSLSYKCRSGGGGEREVAGRGRWWGEGGGGEREVVGREEVGMVLTLLVLGELSLLLPFLLCRY